MPETFWPRPGGRSTIDRHRDVYCKHCGYNLRGIDSGKCPECGHDFDPFHEATIGIPWAHRELDGSVISFIKTVALVIGSPKQIGSVVWQRGVVELPDAKTFRRICVALTWLPLVLLYIGFRHFIRPASATSVDLISVPIGLLIWLMRSTAAVPRLMRHQIMADARHRRAIALAHYIAAPLALGIFYLPLAAAAAQIPSPLIPLALIIAHLWLCIAIALAFIYETIEVNLIELTAVMIQLLATCLLEAIIWLVLPTAVLTDLLHL